MTQKAEIDYLWIDSLCIIQDSVEDWQHESMNMGMVYSGAVCNIAATGFPDGSNGLFIAAEAALDEPIEVQLNADVTAHEGECFRKGDYHLVDFSSWSNGVDNAPLNKRGWVVQESVVYSPGPARPFTDYDEKVQPGAPPYRGSANGHRPR